MSVQELKALAHQLVDKTDSEELLGDVLRLLDDSAGVEEPGMVYFTEEGLRLLEEAEKGMEDGKFLTMEEAREYFRNRFNEK